MLRMCIKEKDQKEESDMRRNNRVRNVICGLLVCSSLCFGAKSVVYAETQLHEKTGGNVNEFFCGKETTTILNKTRTVHQINTIPLLNQCDYPETQYGDYGTIKSHGCGIVSIAMVTSYLTDTFQNPVELAKQFGDYNTPSGSYWNLFEESASYFGIDTPQQTYIWTEVESALKQGQPVICLQSRGLFTSSGHFIVLTGINENGKIIVNDPNGENWEKNQELIEGFKHGFTKEQICDEGGPFWIYQKK